MYADPLNDKISHLCLLKTSGSDINIINAARISYAKHDKSFVDDKDYEIIQNLLKYDHRTPFEHSHLFFYVRCPIFVARQWMRHRIGMSYNELSARRTKIDLKFYVPSIIKNNTNQIVPYKTLINASRVSYHQLLKEGVSREDARLILPLCTYTEFYFSCNLASFFHFLELRDDSNAQWEIRQYSEKMKKMAAHHFPICMGEWDLFRKRKYEECSD